MAATVKYPIGIQEFDKLRNEGFLYVDKTALIKKLVQEGCYYFLSRPRRFGKSLLLSTIHAYFDGKRELFKGLAIDTDDVSWEVHPVIHLDLNAEKYDSKEALDSLLNKQISLYERQYGRMEYDTTIAQRFDSLIRNAYKKTGKRVVILIDEYDKPMLQTIGNKELQDEYLDMLLSLYSALKTMDGYIKFAFVTGVTKFAKVSSFADINHMLDISMDARYCDICGFKEDELHTYFNKGISELARINNLTVDDCCSTLKERYGGYHFDKNTPEIYNPWSILQTIQKKDFADSWSLIDTSANLATLVQQHNRIVGMVTDSATLNCTDGSCTDILPVIYQTGCLTIKDYDKRFMLYTLGFPNKEVEEFFDGMNFSSETRNIDGVAIG